ncbi:MAG: hypothetical protein COB76_06570 [Alphaproteobacteria bacterium]|nr:MAG: hypothetical protein COB76_06570 [Alphaproteobacteria bacterium]
MQAYGPLPGYARPSNNSEDFGGCLPVPVSVKTLNGWKHETVWYGNGPAFFPLNTHDLPCDINVIARYRRIENQPIAACSFPFGKGEILMSGPLPHYLSHPVKKNNLLWSVITHKMHQQLFARQPLSMVSVPA